MSRKSPLKDIIKESLNEMRRGEKDDDFPDDPTLAEHIRPEGPERFTIKQKSRDEIVIDSLLADISGKDGYFIKLKKEIRPNEWMLMKVIENEWRRWADIETAVADIVKEYTKKSPQKWGTGAYRVEIACRGGMRGKGYSPIDIYVNADEEFVASTPGNTGNGQQIDSATQVTSQLDTLAQLVNVVRGVIPAPQDPNIIQQQIANAFQQGMQMKVAESSSSNQMMIAMMTTMMGIMKEIITSLKSDKPIEHRNIEDSMTKIMETLKTFGVLPTQQGGGKEKSVIDFVNELKALGIDIIKKDEPLEQINKLKQLASIANEFIGQGQGEKPSILEKLIDVLGPAVPKMIEDAREAFDKAAQAQALAKQNIEKVERIRALPLSQKQNIIRPINPVTKIIKAIKKSGDAADMVDTSVFVDLTKMLEGNAVGKSILEKAKHEDEESSVIELSTMIRQYVGHEADGLDIEGFVRKFVKWLKENEKKDASSNGYKGTIKPTAKIMKVSP